MLAGELLRKRGSNSHEAHSRALWGLHDKCFLGHLHKLDGLKHRTRILSQLWGPGVQNQDVSTARPPSKTLGKKLSCSHNFLGFHRSLGLWLCPSGALPPCPQGLLAFSLSSLEWTPVVGSRIIYDALFVSGSLITSAKTAKNVLFTGSWG